MYCLRRFDCIVDGLCAVPDAVPALYVDYVSDNNLTTTNVVRDGEVVSLLQPVDYATDYVCARGNH